jgi:hypothetical protein
MEEQLGEKGQEGPLREACLSEKREGRGSRGDVTPLPNRAQLQSFLGHRTGGSLPDLP